jgi:hypothetical protein
MTDPLLKWKALMGDNQSMMWAATEVLSVPREVSLVEDKGDHRAQLRVVADDRVSRL